MNLPEIIRIAYEMGYTLFVFLLVLGLLYLDIILIYKIANKSKSLGRGIRVYIKYKTGSYQPIKKIKEEITLLESELGSISEGYNATTLPMDIRHQIKGLKKALHFLTRDD